MIDIIDDMVGRAKKVAAFGDRVYRAYPQLLDRMDPFAVVTPGSRQVLMCDDEGEEVITQLTYRIMIYDMTPEAVDDRAAQLTSIYNALHIQNTGYDAGFQVSNGMFVGQMMFSAKVDKRGFVFAR